MISPHTLSNSPLLSLVHVHQHISDHTVILCLFRSHKMVPSLLWLFLVSGLRGSHGLLRCLEHLPILINSLFLLYTSHISLSHVQTHVASALVIAVRGHDQKHTTCCFALLCSYNGCWVLLCPSLSFSVAPAPETAARSGHVHWLQYSRQTLKAIATQK